MNKLHGTLDTTSLPEILRMCSVQQKTGTLLLSRAGINKKLYFNLGQLIYITSNKTGERVGEYLIQRGDLTRTWAGFLLKDSQRNGIAFTRSLLKKSIFDKTKLETALSDLANTALADVMSWTTGTYKFGDELSQQALDGPIRISESKALQQIIQQGDHNQATDTTDDLLRNLARKIVTNNFCLSMLPAVAIKLQECWSDNGSASKIIKLVHDDQILSAYLLSVVNSAVDENTQRCATVKQATELYSAEHLTGIIHAKFARAQPPKQPDTMSQLLQHALRCACLAKQIAAQLDQDSELAFTCGLLHNSGKILLLQLLADENISEDELPRLVTKFHQNCGALMSRRWNLAPEVYDCIKHYRNPQETENNLEMVEIIYLSHELLLHPDKGDEALKQCHHLKVQHLKTSDLINNLGLIDEIVAAAY